MRKLLNSSAIVKNSGHSDGKSKRVGIVLQSNRVLLNLRVKIEASSYLVTDSRFFPAAACSESCIYGSEICNQPEASILEALHRRVELNQDHW
jgi:hypothetical protein